MDNRNEGAGVYTDKEGQLWVFEAVETDGINELANEEMGELANGEMGKFANEGGYDLQGRPSRIAGPAHSGCRRIMIEKNAKILQ